MVWVAGADGCKAGWFRVSRQTETAELRFDVIGAAGELLTVAPRPAVVALDIPIGLPEAGRRACDQGARQCLGWPRATSVFPAPIRPALRARDRLEAARITQSRDGRKVGAQAWALYAKIREVDALLQASAEARSRLHEVHPEVSFWAWSGGRAIAEGKKTSAGRAKRLKLAEDWLGHGVLASARGGRLKKDVADDDILDAIAVLWTAERILHGASGTLPEGPPSDSTGLPMRIVY